jgi:hypothetical protein
MSDKSVQDGRANGKFTITPAWLWKCPAYRSLSTNARALFYEFRFRFNGYNNGQIHFSVREMAASINVKYNGTAISAHRELQAKGFVKVATKATFDTRKGGLATEWILTCENLNGSTATKEFMRWKGPEDDFPVSDGLASHQRSRGNSR